MARDEKGRFTVVCVGMPGESEPCSWKMEGEQARDALRAAEREAV